MALGLSALLIVGSIPPKRVAAQEQAARDQLAQERPAPMLPERAPAPFMPDPSQAPPAGDKDTWIFSGVLQDSREVFSGTLVTSKTETQFELKLAGGATCDGDDLLPGTGLVRLSEIICSDDRTMRALFVPQGGEELRVFGHVGDKRFMASAHLLGTAPMSAKRQSAAPKAPGGPGAPMPAPASPSKLKPG